MHFSRCFLYAGLANSGLAAVYKIKDVYDSSNWANSFSFDTVSMLRFHLVSS